MRLGVSEEELLVVLTTTPLGCLGSDDVDLLTPTATGGMSFSCLIEVGSDDFRRSRELENWRALISVQNNNPQNHHMIEVVSHVVSGTLQVSDLHNDDSYTSRYRTKDQEVETEA